MKAIDAVDVASKMSCSIGDNTRMLYCDGQQVASELIH